MKLITALSLALGVHALPQWGGWNDKCVVNDALAQKYVADSIIFLAHPDIAAADAAANAIFDPSIMEYGDSINALRMAPLGTEVEDGLATYIKDTTSAPVIAQINTLNIVYDCSSIVWHWEFIGIGPQRIRGFTLAMVNSQGLVYEQFVEFNSLTWAEDIGFTVTPPTTGPFSAGGSGRK